MKISEFLSKDELSRFTARSNLQGFRMLAVNWLLIFAIFFVVASWTNPITVLLGVLLLGSRQLGLGILMHEAGHRSLFRSSRLNEVLGQWLCAYPILADMEVYAKYHRSHHLNAGTEKDPDLPNYQAYPVSKASFQRKVMRDLTGQSGLKLVASIFMGKGDMIIKGGKATHYLIKSLLVNAFMVLGLWAFGCVELYLLWMVAYVTTYTFVARIRQIAEHGGVPDLFNPDPRMHTRTTKANWLERLLFCPNYVNYHAEHHFVASVPCYRLKDLHEHLVSKGFYAGHEYACVDGYWGALKQAVPEFRGPRDMARS